MPNDLTVAVIEKIEDMAQNHITEIGGQQYTEKQLTRIPPHVDRPSPISITGLDSVVKLIKKEIDRLGVDLFVRINSFKSVDVLTTYNPDFSRDVLYKVETDIPEQKLGWDEYEAAMIRFRSQYIYNLDDPNDGVKYLLDLLSKITNEESVASSDNGLTQTVEAKSGIALVSRVAVNPRVKLRPFRTFREVMQPESEFLVRLDKDKGIGLFEADGGMWKLAAKSNIKDFFEFELAELISAGSVVVMM